MKRRRNVTSDEDFAGCPILEVYDQQNDFHVDRGNEAREDLQAPWEFPL